MNTVFNNNITSTSYRGDVDNIIYPLFNILNLSYASIFITNIDAFGSDLDDGLRVAVNKTSSAINQAKFDFRDSNPDFLDSQYILLLRDDVLYNGSYVQDFNGNLSQVSTTRILFHELIHTVFEWSPRVNGGLNFEEELAIFAENTIYSRAAFSLGQSDGSVVRFSHDADIPYSGGGVSGISSFSLFSNVSIGMHNNNIATFVANENGYSITKSYFNYNHQVFNQYYDHYITLEESSSVPYVVIDQTGLSINSRTWNLTSDMMGSSYVSSFLSTASAAAFSAFVSTGNSGSFETTRILGIGNDSFAGKDNGVIKTYTGAVAANSSSIPISYNIDDDLSLASTLIIGAGHGVSSEHIRAGKGNDIIIATGIGSSIYGGLGDDIIVGTSGNDHIFGGGDSDIIAGSGGIDEIDGGDGVDILTYASSSSGISFNVITGQGFGGQASGDSISSIERLIGTGYSDNFVAGYGALIDGRNGGDFYEVGNQPVNIKDTGSNGLDILSFSSRTSGIIFNPGSHSTIFGDIFIGIEKIIGTNFDDTMYGSSSVILEGGNGGDTFIMDSSGIAYGQDGNDSFYISGFSGTLPVIHGGDGYDRIEITSTAFDSYNMATGDFINYDNSISSVTGIEEVTFKWGTVFGSSGTDHIINTMMGVAYGRGGDDFMTGISEGIHGGIEGLFGEAGNDYLVSLGWDNLYGGADNDTLVGNYKTRLMDGGSGDDIIYSSTSSGHTVEIRTGTGNNEVHGDGSINSEVKYGFTMNHDPGLMGDDDSLISIFDRGSYFEVNTTQGTDKIFGIPAIYFESTYGWIQKAFEVGMAWINPNGPPSEEILSAPDYDEMYGDIMIDFAANEISSWRTIRGHELDYHLA